MRLFLALAAMIVMSGAWSAETRAAELEIKDMVEGSGPAAAPGHNVTVHYDGRLADGTPFDSSRNRGRPFTFRLGAGRVIRGWEIGVQGMRAGGIRQLVIPPELGYGSRDLGIIPPNSTLVFDIELLRME